MKRVFSYSADLFVYNLGEIKNSSNYRTVKKKLRQKHYDDGDVIETLPLTNFGKIFKAHFGEIEENVGSDNEIHNYVFRDNYKIYYHYNNEVETNSIFLMIVGKQAIVELLKLGRIHNWAVLTPDGNGLIHLDSLPS